MFKGFDNLDPLMFCQLNTAPTGGHYLKLVKPRCRLDVRNIRLHIGWLTYGTVWMKRLLHVIH